ncbi:MAG: NAD(P)H:quinone oxidoreductase [Actinomycetes bacterium]
MADQVRAAVIYYSATGNVYTLAERAAQTAEKTGADVRLRKVRELAPRTAIEANGAWKRNVEQTREVAEATVDDLEWADVVLLGTPTRFGNVAAQLKQYMDQAGPLWAKGKLVDKVFAGFTSTTTRHGGHESTLLALYTTVYHWGGIVVGPGYTDPVQFEAGNPYGASHTSANGETPVGDIDLGSIEVTAERAVRVARALKVGKDA